jgi:eukaryotic-like serine/threonine-protein kinase
MMAYCPECGSEVAPNNTFCAYCGIALQTVSDAGNNVSQPQSPELNELKNEVLPDIEIIKEKTSVSESNADIQSKPVELNSSTQFPPTPTILDKEDSKPIETINSPNVEELKKDTLENWSMKTDSVELKDISKEIFEDESITDNYAGFEEPKLNEPIELANQNQFSPESEEKPFSLEAVEIPVSQENAIITENSTYKDEAPLNDSPNKNLNNVEYPDFSETIPDTSSEYNENPSKMDSGDKESASLAFKQQEKIGTPELPTKEENKSTEVFSSEEFIKSLESENKPEFFESDLILDDEPIKTDISEPLDNKLNVDSNYIPETTESNKLEDAEADKIVSRSLPELSTPAFVSPLESKETQTENEVYQQVSDDLPIANEPNDSRPFTNHNIGVIDTDGNKSAKLKPLEEGTILNNRYEIARKIGGGGMGAVYLANDKNLGGVLRAVKEMVQSSIEDEQQEKAINDFKREATILSALEHPAIPTIFDYFFDEKEGRFYLVMKYISGGDLAARLRSAPEGKIDESTVTDWGIQLADVLNYLHKQEPPIVYRDLKPSNIMIDGNTGRIMLIDFGIARLINSEQADVTAVGTMGYAPPELYRKNVEPRSDIFSLGATMFHLLTGADPQSNPLLIFDFNKHPRPRQINSLLSDQMEQILMRSVELDSANRFDSAAEMRDTLKTHLDNLLKGSVSHGVVKASSKMSPASNLPVFCGFCGQKIVATDQFCPFCGSQQPTGGQSSNLQQTPIYSVQKMTARVLVVGTNELGTPEFSLDKETNLVGRRDPMSNIFPEVDLSKYDPQTKISRKHARIWRENDAYMLEDLGSSNGTVVMSSINDSVRLLPRQPHVLANGDKIKVGDTTLHFFIG